jgi:rubrerythrin
LFEKVMARMFPSLFRGIVSDRRNWTNLAVRAYVFPEPAEALRTVKLGSARSVSFSRRFRDIPVIIILPGCPCQTEKNLLAAFAGESQARNRYTYFASAAKKEGYEQISALFLETADNEKEHGKLFFKLLQGGEAEILAGYPAGVIGKTADNLSAAAAGENLEWTTLYRNFADVARQEGFEQAYQTFTHVARVEKFHEARYLSLLRNVREGKVFRKDFPAKWHCRNCGFVHEGTEVPEVCPVCQHPRAFFEVLAENH